MSEQLREKIAAMLEPVFKPHYYFTADEKALALADDILSLMREEGVDLEGWRPRVRVEPVELGIFFYAKGADSVSLMVNGIQVECDGSSIG